MITQYRIIFVGIHNKPGKLPLDSYTKTGKIVDEIASMFARWGDQIVKTNLYNIDSMPEGATHAAILVADFFYQHQFTQRDIVVLLGKDVQTVLTQEYGMGTINLNHPSSIYGGATRKAYIDDAIDRIEKVRLPF